jgi:hypothetical protein
MRPNHAIDSSKLGVTVVVTVVELYDVLIRGVMLYLMDYWTETTVYRLGWQSGDGRMS